MPRDATEVDFVVDFWICIGDSLLQAITEEGHFWENAITDHLMIRWQLNLVEATKLVRLIGDTIGAFEQSLRERLGRPHIR